MGGHGMTRIGIVGIGFMGRIHFLASQSLTNAKVTAVCSRDETKLAGDWSKTRGNFGPEPGHVDLSGIKKYRDFAAMCADPEIDLIDICTVTDQHAPLAIQALRAGKHVLVEKAIALDQDQADEMVAVAKENKRLLMVAHVLPFFPEFRYAYDVASSGKFGKFLGGTFKRVISKPDWSADIGDAAKTGGPAVDLHIHDTHFIGLIAGKPQGVFSTGVVEKGVVTHVNTQYLYRADGPSVTCTSGALAMNARPFVHGYELYFEKATLVYESGTCPLTQLNAVGTSEVVQLPVSGNPLEAFTIEIQTAVESIAEGKAHDLLSGQLARDALVMCFKEIESVKTQKVVALD